MQSTSGQCLKDYITVTYERKKMNLMCPML
jgi:hypothetical protein